MSVLVWLTESAARFALLVAAVACLLTVLRITGAETRLRVWTLVLLAATVLPFVPTLWAIPVPDSTGGSTGFFAGSTSVMQAAVAQPPVVVPLSLGEVLLAVYSAGVVILMTRLCVGYLWTRRLRASAHKVPGQPFMESALVHVPVTVGLLTPAVIVPDTWRTWPEDTLTAVIAHEHAHASRRDGLWATFAQLHRALHWCNPLSWWLTRHLISLSERASDDAALRKGITPARYAEILLGFARVVSSGHPRVAWIVPMARPSGRDTERRVDRVLHWKGRAEMNRSRLVLLAVILVAGSAAVYTATITSLSALPPDKAPLDRFVLTQFQPTGDERDIKVPILLTQVNPEYTEEGRRRRIEGIVELEVAISHMGHVTSATVKKSLDTVFGLDDAAVAAAKRWYFVPRTVSGRAVASTAVVQMEFRLPDAPEPVRDTQQQPDPEVIAPVAIKRVEPKYTPEAMRAKIQGKVRIEAVVNTNGDVVNARILESLDAELGLDASALTAASQWKYEPGRYKGKAVASKVVIDMEFRLH